MFENKEQKRMNGEFEMLALHTYETLRITKENVGEFKKLATESEKKFIDFLKKNSFVIQEQGNDQKE